ncbi:DsbA family protein [Sphingorhabdus pulchriflava]|uniref:DsbA family protein n=1 Tax=Sphingorhabdus pulchriflava TaxID=2292257 RepID=A0A371BHW0_9SPHN|nr:DsbA family protein [Sphingorhabdus pulchriflava]RDV07128.1 DsbA family protein [Sphingorhabdus pulchriflava]
MNDQQTSNRLPLILVLVGAAILAAAGYYFFANNEPAIRGDKAIYAAQDAERAISAAGVSDKERAATEAIVRAYILENPEIITEAVEILQKREMAKRMDAAGSTVTKAFLGAVGGNPEGAITVVEFTDYNCGFCRSSVADLNRLVGSEKDVRIVYRELPILSPTSRDAARWALAAAKQGKHKAFHDAMFASGPANEQTITAAARKAGLNMDQAAKDAASQEVNAEIERNLAMMQQIGFNGTPTFIIGDQMLEGALGYDALKAAVEKARKKG